MEEEFKTWIYERCEGASFRAKSIFALLLCLSAAVGYWSVRTGDRTFFILAILFGVLAGFIILKFRGDLMGGKYWVDLINNKPEEIVWIKPVLEKQTVYYVVTLFKERKFQFLTKDGLKIMMKCDTPEHQKIFLLGIRNHLPKAQFGYSPEVEMIYGDGPEDFIRTLIAKGLYYPVERITT